MCPPNHFDVTYEINPWMDITNKPDKKKAYAQWQSLYDLYIKLGVEVELIDQQEGLPDMVFTANAGTVKDKMFISGNYRFKERKKEEIYFQHWFRNHGFTIKTLTHSQGGEGDALFYQGTLFMGYGFRSEKEVAIELQPLLEAPLVTLRLIDPYFYDFDTTFCPLGNRAVLYYPQAYALEDREKVGALEHAIPMTKEQADHFVGNSVYVDGKLIVSFLDKDLQKKLAKIDIEPILLDMSEYKKAGGGIKCLTLYISP